MHSGSTTNALSRLRRPSPSSGKPVRPPASPSGSKDSVSAWSASRLAAWTTSRPASLALGELAGTRAVAERAAADYRARIAALRDRYRGRPTVRVFVQIDDVPLYTIGGPHLISEILGLCGGENVFADASAQALPVDLESVLVRSPEVILSTDTDEPAPYWARFGQLTAVARGNLYQSNGDLLARPSPRIADGAADVCARLDEARAKREAP